VSRLGRGALAATVVAAAVGVSAVGCIPPRPPASAPPPSAVEPTASAADTPAPSTPGSTSPASPSTAAGIVVDPALLDHLPPDIAGVQRTADAETAAEIARQPLLDTFVSAIAMAIYPSNPDYAVATVARLRPGVYDEAWFRDWRDTFDEGVCAQAGGVDTGRSELELGGRQVHRSACQGGVVIYHAWLPDSGTVVSVQGAGPLDMGRSIVSGLTE
jgi:hypothetical protein